MHAIASGEPSLASHTYFPRMRLLNTHEKGEGKGKYVW